MENSKQKGDITELQCLTEFTKMGFICSVPYGDNSRYDILVDTGREIIKVQCKTAIYNNKNKESFRINCTNSSTFHGEWIRKKYNKNQIDVFATYINGTMYIIPVEEAGTTVIFRLTDPKNNWKSRIRYAKDYTAQKFFENHDTYLNEEQNISKIKQYKCIVCGESVKNEGTMCNICAHKASRKVERPSREELKDFIRSTSFWQIGKNFGVSDVMIHKWCKQYGLPYRKRDIKKINEEDWKNI